MPPPDASRGPGAAAGTPSRALCGRAADAAAGEGRAGGGEGGGAGPGLGLLARAVGPRPPPVCGRLEAGAGRGAASGCAPTLSSHR